jgi:RHS repeat-associated protein
MTKVEESSTTIAQYVYDALNRRISKDADSTVRHFLYSSDWQSLEECLDGSTSAERQHIWGSQYIDQLILRDRDTSDPANGVLDERLYALQDANWNVTAIVDTGGSAVERYVYDPYGEISFFDGSFANSTGSYDNPYSFTARRFDKETAFNYFRNRYHATGLGHFTSQDPLRQVGNPNLYAYVASNPVKYVDPQGTQPQSPGPYNSVALHHCLCRCNCTVFGCLLAGVYARSSVERAMD